MLSEHAAWRIESVFYELLGFTVNRRREHLNSNLRPYVGPVLLTLFLQCADVFGDELSFEK